ncbi:MAG: glutamyl-tRNA reductase [Planctomycetota bacterium]|jgi:glutamyl-tRNA reductase
MQRFAVLGVNHKFAPLEVRERVAYSDRKIPAALRALVEDGGCDEIVLLSTCNRVEAFCFSEDENPFDAMVETIASDHNLSTQFLEPYVYFHRGQKAIEHLLRVAGGLDSLVLGETQILNQVKRAYLLAQSENTTGKALNSLFHRAFSVSKRLHTETNISSGQFSISSVAVHFMNRVFNDLSTKTALLIGAGEVGELTLTHLKEAGIGRIVVLSRTLERAKDLANRFEGDAVPFDLLQDYLPTADIVISQTSSETPILDVRAFKKSQKARGWRSVFALDLAVPRDIAEDCGNVEGVFLYNVDDLEGVIAERTEARSRELEKCNSIIESEAEAFLSNFEGFKADDAISELREKTAKVRDYELERLMSKLSELSPEARQEISSFSERLSNKLLHPQLHAIREEATKGDESEMNRLIKMLGVDKPIKLNSRKIQRRINTTDDESQTEASQEKSQ